MPGKPESGRSHYTSCKNVDIRKTHGQVRLDNAAPPGENVDSAITKMGVHKKPEKRWLTSFLTSMHSRMPIIKSTTLQQDRSTRRSGI